MSDEKDKISKAGLGKLVYSDDSPQTRKARGEASDAEAEVDEESDDSFPASDPPSFTSAESTKTDDTPS